MRARRGLFMALPWAARARFSGPISPIGAKKIRKKPIATTGIGEPRQASVKD